MPEMVARAPRSRRRGARSQRWINVVTWLNDNAKTWGYVGEFSPGISTQIRKGQYPAFLPPDFNGDRKAYMEKHYEVTVEMVKGTRRCDLYIRKVA